MSIFTGLFVRGARMLPSSSGVSSMKWTVTNPCSVNSGHRRANTQGTRIVNRRASIVGQDSSAYRPRCQCVGGAGQWRPAEGHG